MFSLISGFGIHFYVVCGFYIYLFCDEVNRSNFKKRKKPFCTVPIFFTFFDCGMFFCIYTALREDVKNKPKEKNPEVQQKTYGSTLRFVTYLSCMSWNGYFCPDSVGKLKSFTDLPWHLGRVHTSTCTVALDGRKTWQIGRTLICSWILTRSWWERSSVHPVHMGFGANMMQWREQWRSQVALHWFFLITQSLPLS